MKGKALQTNKNWPKCKDDVVKMIPPECFVRDTCRSMKYAMYSVVLTLLSASFGYLIPQELKWAPVWLIWGFITGTICTGNWVVAHECGHNAFSDNKFLQDTVGYILHTCLLVPYYSW